MRHSSRTPSALVIAGLVGSTMLLAGCGELAVLNAGSAAACEAPSGAVTLMTSQDAAGEQLTVEYSGPSGLAVVFSYGYSIEDVPEAQPTGAYAYAQSGHNNDGTAYLLRLDPLNDPGWSSSEVSGTLTATFTGSIDELLDGRDAQLAFNDGTAIAEVAPVFIGVICDPDFESGQVDTLDSDAENAPELLLAAALNPDSVRIGPFEITEQSTVDGVTTGKLRFASGASSVFGDFVPVTVAEATVVEDVADVPNDTFSQLWFQEFIRDAAVTGYFEITTALTLDGEMDFTFTSNAAPEPLPEGLHRLRIVFGNTNLITPNAQVDATSSEMDERQIRDLDPGIFTPAAAGDAKVAFFDVTYDEVAGLHLGAAQGTNGDGGELADTGSPLAELIALFAGTFVVAGIILLTARRRQIA